ncbi:SCO family protein [Longibacter salinarum]|nr:SCO family protein [Longibacter salinarum]
MKQLLAVPLILLILVGTTFPATATTHPDSTGLPETSIYQLTSTWTTQDEATVQLKNFRGRPQLIAIVYTHCGYACPMIVQNMKRVLGTLSDPERAQVGRILVTMDPERDTPKRLREFATTHDLDLADWTLLRSTDTDVRELSAVLGVRYQQEASGMFSHSSIITVVDADGVIVHQQPAINRGIQASSDALRQLLNAAPQ